MTASAANTNSAIQGCDKVAKPRRCSPKLRLSACWSEAAWVAGLLSVIGPARIGEVLRLTCNSVQEG